MAKFKLMQKSSNPADKTAAKKWYATPISEKALSATATTRAATENTSTGPTEMDGSCYILRRYAEKQLLQGHIATIPYFGTLRVTFKSSGAEKITDFHAGEMIKEPRIMFTPSKEFREAVINNLTFECGGVIADGITYGSVKNYRMAIGEITDGSGDDDNNDTGGDDGGSGTGGNPL